MNDLTAEPKDIFVTTRWSVVLSAGRKSSPNSEKALSELCTAYWFPLYAFVRKRVNQKEEAENLTQAFFEKFLKKNYLGQLSPDQGKFRAYMLAALKNFLANEWDRKKRLKRGGSKPTLPMDWQAADSRYRSDRCEVQSPEKLFDREWALALLEKVILSLQNEYDQTNRSLFFKLAKPFLSPAGHTDTYATVAKEMKMDEGAVRVAVHRMRKRYRELLREEIAQTLTDPTHVDEEYQAHREALRQ